MDLIVYIKYNHLNTLFIICCLLSFLLLKDHKNLIMLESIHLLFLDGQLRNKEIHQNTAKPNLLQRYNLLMNQLFKIFYMVYLSQHH